MAGQRGADQQVEALVPRLATMANPADPGSMRVSRPSDVLVARGAVESAYNGLFLGLGAVALLVGTVGIANVMVIGVLERRGEIGLRRATGASRPHIRRQFLVESIILSSIGGIAGLLLGTAGTLVYAVSREWDTVVPASGLLRGLAASIFAGTLAGIYPAARAARLSPTEALRAVG